MIVPVNEESNLGSNVMKFQLKQIPDMITRNNYEDERKCQVVIVLKVSAGALARKCNERNRRIRKKSCPTRPSGHKLNK